MEKPQNSNATASTSSVGADGMPGRVLLIDDDSSMRAAMAKLLSDSGVGVVTAADEGEAGWGLIKEGDFDLIILDWKMAPLSGANVLHRLRAAKEYDEIPVLVVSGYIKKRDFRFAEEYLFTSMLEKPFDSFFFLRRIKDLMKEKRWYEKEQERINDILARTTDKERDGLGELITLLLGSPRIVAVSLHAAKSFFKRGDLVCAESVLKILLQKSPECVLALSLLGKINLQRKDYTTALDLLEKAHQLSPENPDRLCMLGSANLQMLKVEEASEYFDAADKLDPSFEKAKAGKALTKNVVDYLNNSDVATVPTSFSSLMNSIGVAFVRNGRIQDGLKHYESALQYLDQDILQARVSFNLGLGYLRWKKKEEALRWFEKSSKLGGPEFDKAGTYVTKLSSKGVTAPPVDFDSLPFEGESKEPAKDNVVENDAPTTDVFGKIDAVEMPLSKKQTVSGGDQAGSFGFDEESFLSNEDLSISGGKTRSSNQDAPQFARIEPNMPVPKQSGDPEIQKLQTLMQQLVMADKTLFKTTGHMSLSQSHEAYAGTFDGQSVAVFIPNTHAPKLLARAENSQLLRSKVVILVKNGVSWQKIWPRPHEKATA